MVENVAGLGVLVQQQGNEHENGRGKDGEKKHPHNRSGSVWSLYPCPIHWRHWESSQKKLMTIGNQD